MSNDKICRSCNRDGPLQPFRWRTSCGDHVKALFCYDCHVAGTAQQNAQLKAQGKGGKFTSQWQGPKP